MLSTLAGIPLADIPTVAGPEALEARYVNHQLAVNSCLLAVREACRAHPGATLYEWTADPPRTGAVSGGTELADGASRRRGGD